MKQPLTTLNTVPVQNAGTSSRNSYLQILDDAWQQHLAPRAENAPTVISTFAGGGGSSLGYSMAGYRELLAVEWDNNAVETFRLNFPDVPVYHGDIAKLSVDECLRLAGIQAGELDVFDGSPPCQGFSTAGKRMIDDPRNQLFREYVRLLRGLQPKVFVMENVSGMVKGKMKLVFVEILKELKDSGYRVKACLMNAMYFNVPQSRQRMIFIGVRNDLGIEPSHPKAQSRPITVQVAIEGCLSVPRLANSERISFYWIKLNPGQCIADIDPKGNGYTAVKILPNKPSPTLTKGWTAGTGLMHFAECRFLSDAEVKRIGSFPDNYIMVGNSSSVIQRIGNSVPPLFMRAISEHIRQHILE